MGRGRKRLNSTAGTTTRTNEMEEKVILHLDVRKEKYDSSNVLVLSGKKSKKAKILQKTKPVAKPLSKKQRKKLSKVLERKKRKFNRAELLEKLSHVQANPEELKFLTSTADMQTSGMKRIHQEYDATDEKSAQISNIKGSNKKNKLPAKKRLKFDPNVVGLEMDSSSSDSEDGMSSHDESSSGNIEADHPVEVDEECAVIECKKVDNSDSQMVPNNPKKTIAQIAPVKVDRTPAVFVTVNRTQEMQAARQALPIFCEEQSLIEAIKENSVVIIHGETGSGKTTQVPQFLYEAGFTQNDKLIGITEPRRIAAMTMSARVGIELNMPEVVSYHIRYQKTVSDKTHIKFMTDGVLLKEIRHDFFLTRYSVIIIDEAHERSVFSDVLIGLLSRIVPLREKKGDPLKLIVMSATIRVEDFTENPRLFKVQPSLIRLTSRQHKVQVHFSIHTPENYVEAAFQKVCKIHDQLPPGAILVFLTGEREVKALCNMLRKAFPSRNTSSLDSKADSKPEKVEFELEKTNETLKKKQKRGKKQQKDQSFCSLPAKFNLDDYAIEPLDTEDLEHQLSDEENDIERKLFHIENAKSSTPLHTLPLFAILPFEEQEKVFKPPPPGSRLCVVSTNVAETSITIPGLKYVVDSGKVKTKVYDNNSGGISKFMIAWSSKASANQRAGRCGRTEGGHCYRLYSSAVFENDLPDFYAPEIQRTPVDDVLLQMKAIGIDRVVDFPFPSPPDKEALKEAEKRLVLLGALHDLKKGERYRDLKKWEFSAKVTPLGQAMSRFPLSPRYAKMILLSYKHHCIPHIVAIVAGMTVPQLFMSASDESQEKNNEEGKEILKGIKKIGGKALQLGDAMVLLRSVALFLQSNMGIKFCIKNGIRHKAMVEIHKMSLQLLREMNQAFSDLSMPLKLELKPPNNEKIEVLRKIVAACFTDHVARRLPVDTSNEDNNLRNAYKCLDLEEPVFIHPSSILFDQLPEYVLYQEIIHTSKYYMKGVLELNAEWLPAFAPNLCEFSAPLEEPPPIYDSGKDSILCTLNVTFGRWQWEIPKICMEMPTGLLKYSWFCFFFLDGQVCSFMKSYRKHLLSDPSVMLKTWAKLLARSRYMLQAVIAKEIDSFTALKKIWQEEPKYLLREFCQWIPQEKQMEVELKWPPTN